MIRSSSLAKRWYSIEPATRKYVKGCRFLLFTRKYKNQLLDTGVDYLKLASKTEVHRPIRFLGSKIADAMTKSNDDKIVKHDESPRNVQEIIIRPEKGEKY